MNQAAEMRPVDVNGVGEGNDDDDADGKEHSSRKHGVNVARRR
jgi:hypothetical protein